MAYRDFTTLSAPSWLQGPNGGAFVGELGGAKDDILDKARLGVLARFPGKVVRELGATAVEAPGDALDYTGADRQTPRAPGEADQFYSVRLVTAWDDLALLGGPFALLNSLSIMGYVGANIIQDNGRYWYLSAGALASGTLMTHVIRGRPGWTFDGRDDLWSRFALLFTADATNLSGRPGQIILNSIVHRLRPALATYMGAFVTLSGRIWGWPTTVTWGDGGLWGGSSRFIPADDNPAVVL